MRSLRFRPHRILSILLLVCLAGCTLFAAAPPPTATPSSIPPTPTVTPSPTSTPTVTPWPAARRPEYTLLTLVDYDAHSIAVAEGIVYSNTSPDALAEIVLAVEPNLWAGCFSLTSLKADRELAGFDLSGQTLVINFVEPLPEDATVILAINYTLDLPDTQWGNDDTIRNLIFGYSLHQTNLMDWYPFIVPYMTGQGWLLHDPGLFGEHLLYDPADFIVLLVFPAASINNPLVAAPGSAQRFGNGWRFELQDARNFAISMSREFAVTSAQTNSGVTVKSYYFSEDARGGLLALQTAVQAVEVFSEKFAPYPRQELTIVQGDFVPSMEYDGLVYIGNTNYHQQNDTARDFLVVLTAHEVSHQWWFALVANDQATEPWLDESLATYSEKIFYESIHPDDVDWWQEMRLDPSRSLSGWVDASIYDFSNSYNDAVYLRGAIFLEELRQRVGEEAFFDFLQAYAARFTGKRANSGDFFRLLREQTRVDFSDIITKYFNEPH